MRHSLWYKRIPTLLGLILLGTGILTVSWLVKSGALFSTKASPSYAPTDIRISNLSDTSFTVSYKTTEAVTGSLSYGTSPAGGKVILDDRDQQTGTPKPYQVHHITVKSLTAKTKYYFTIISSDKTFLDNDQPFTLTTLDPLSEAPSNQLPIVGKVVYPDGSTNTNVIVYLVSENTQLFSVLTKDDGSFAMPLNALRTKDYTSYVTFDPTSAIKLLVISPTLSSNINVLVSQISPVPQITLGNSYDFATSQTPVTPTPTPMLSPGASESAQQPDETQASFPSFSATESTPDAPHILTPNDQEKLSDQQPQFAGTAPPNTTIQILIQSNDEIKTTVTADKTGNWSYRPTTKLAPGNHTITVSAKDSQGILQTIKRSFTVYAEGALFVEPSVSPSPTPTPLILISNTPTPTPTATPTPTPTVVVTVPPTVTVPPPTKSPGSSAVVVSSIIASVTIGVGLLLFFLARVV